MQNPNRPGLLQDVDVALAILNVLNAKINAAPVLWLDQDVQPADM